MKKRAKKIGVAIVGWPVLIVGLIMIPYPGPGWVTVFLGLGILSTEFDWAKRLLQYAKGKYDAWEAWVKQQNKSVKVALWLFTALIVVVTLWLLNGYGIMNDVLGLGWDWVRSPLSLFN